MDRKLMDVLVCPVTKGKLIKRDNELWSRQAGLAFPIRDGIPVLIEEEARSLSVEEVESVRNI